MHDPFSSAALAAAALPGIPFLSSLKKNMAGQALSPELLGGVSAQRLFSLGDRLHKEFRRRRDFLKVLSAMSASEMLSRARSLVRIKATLIKQRIYQPMCSASFIW